MSIIDITSGLLRISNPSDFEIPDLESLTILILMSIIDTTSTLFQILNTSDFESQILNLEF
jgi:hypothetical protein